MAGSRPSSVSSQSSSSQTFTSRLLLLLTLLPLTLAAFAFVLQWRGELTDPVSRWSPDHHEFPGMENNPYTRASSKTKDSGCADLLGPTRYPSFPYYRNWNFDLGSDLKPKMCITTSTSAGLEQTLPWIFYHRVIGVSTFFLFVEGKAASHNVSKVLETIPGVKVIFRARELEEKQVRSRIWNETWLASFFYKPCNYELFVKQSLNMEMAIVMAREAGMDWIIHLDTDELIHPAGGGESSLTQLLSDVPGNVDMESSVERDDIKEPFSEVSMFKKNYDHLPKDVYFGNYREATRGNPNYFLTYGNGKSAARIQDHLRPNGAHRWHNYMKNPNEIKLDEAAVLHYTYPKFSDSTSRHDRCGCKPTKDDVKRCFMLEFDRAAFIICFDCNRRGNASLVIVQGLRESGVFTNTIAMAQSNLTDFLSKVVNSNSSKVAKSGSISSRKIGRNGESQATARRVLHIADDGSFPLAVPSQSPPLLEDFQIEI